MRAAVILAMATAALVAQPGSANVLTYHCDGFGGRPNAGQVTVMHSFSSGGQPVDSFAIWVPRAEVANPLWSGFGVNLELQIEYSNPTVAGIGPIDSAFLTLQIHDPFGSEKTSESLQSELTKLKVDASIDGRAPVTLVWDKDQPAFEWPNVANSRVTIRFPASARSATFTVRNNKGQAVNTTRFDLAQTSDRDARYKIAREKADKAALDYKSCMKSG